MGFGGQRYHHLLPGDPFSKLEYAFHLAAALSFLMVKQGDRIGLTLFEERIARHLKPGGTFGHLYQILQSLERTEPGGRTELSVALREVYPLIRRRGLLIIISDFLDDPIAVFKALNLYRHRRFEIILFHLMHCHERRLPSLPNVNFIDSETGEWITTRPDDIRKGYEEKIGGHIAKLAALACARGIDYHFLTTETPYAKALEEYMQRRSKI
jgi:uncharacterized protein (DUF58 family)